MSTNSIYTLNLSTANFNYTQSLEIHAKQDDDNALIAYPRAHIDNHQAPHYIYWSKASNKTFTLMKPPTTYGKLLLDHTSLYLPKCRPPSDFRYEVTIENRGSRTFWENSRSRIVFSVSLSDCFFGMKWLLKIEEVGFFGKILVLGVFFSFGAFWANGVDTKCNQHEPSMQHLEHPYNDKLSRKKSRKTLTLYVIICREN